MDVSIQQPDFLKICFLLGVEGKDFESGIIEKGMAYSKNGMIMFLNGDHLWITRANSFSEKALEKIGYTINKNDDVFVPNLNATHKLNELVKNEIMAGNMDKQSIIEKVMRNEEIRFALAFNCDPLLNDEQEINRLQQGNYGGIIYGNIYKVVSQIYRQSKFFNTEEYINTTFYDYCLPVIENMLVYYSQHMPNSDSLESPNEPKSRR